MMSRLSWMIAASMVLALGCSQGEPESDDGTNEGAARIETESGLSIDFISVQDSKPATNVEADQEMKNCETNVEYVQISGTKVDAKVNALLKKGNEAPATCEDAESVDSSSTIKFMGKNFLTVAESGSWYSAGAAHPSFGITYKNIDLTTGEQLTLDKVLLPEAKAKLIAQVKAQIRVQKTQEKGPDGKMIVTKLDADSKAALNDALTYAIPADGGLDKVTSFSLSSSGVRIDLTNDLPHALQGLDCVYLVKWSKLSSMMVPAMKTRLGVK